MAKDPKKTSYLREFYKGIIIENPVFRLVLGTCPTLAVTTAAMNALGMGAAATLVLVCSNVAISLLRNVIPDKVRIAAYITIIAGFVSIVQMFVKAYSPELDKSLGIYLPLIVVNCIILGRAEMFASKNKVIPSALDGLGMGIGFTLALLVMGSIRELIGAGTLFGFPITVQFMAPMNIFHSPSRRLLCLRNAGCFGKQNHHQKRQSAEKSTGLRRLSHGYQLLPGKSRGVW